MYSSFCTVHEERAVSYNSVSNLFSSPNSINSPLSCSLLKTEQQNHVTREGRIHLWLELWNLVPSTVMCRLTTGICSEKCVIRRIRRCANVIESTYINLETWHWLDLLMDESPFRPLFPFCFIHIEDLLWQVTFLPQSGYLRKKR